MAKESMSVDQLYLNAESLAQDFSLFPRKEPASVIGGLLTERQIEVQLEQLGSMEVDAYIAATVAPTEESTRPGARDVIKALGVPILREESDGPFYACELAIEFNGATRIIGFITQDRAHATGVWGPEHHNAAAKIASEFATRSMPIVTFMDTPGADPYEEANFNNQAHSISRLIARFCWILPFSNHFPKGSFTRNSSLASSSSSERPLREMVGKGENPAKPRNQA